MNKIKELIKWFDATTDKYIDIFLICMWIDIIVLCCVVYAGICFRNYTQCVHTAFESRDKNIQIIVDNHEIIMIHNYRKIKELEAVIEQQNSAIQTLLDRESEKNKEIRNNIFRIH
jgi:hypothetical protein